MPFFLRGGDPVVTPEFQKLTRKGLQRQVLRVAMPQV